MTKQKGLDSWERVREARRRLLAHWQAMDDSTPNLRDYGLQNRVAFEAALEEHHRIQHVVYCKADSLTMRARFLP